MIVILIVYLDRISSLINEQERKSLLISHYPEHRHLFSHMVKVQRHSDPSSNKWVTEGPQEENNTGSILFRMLISIDFFLSSGKSIRRNTSSNVLHLALNSSALKLSHSWIILFLLILCRR